MTLWKYKNLRTVFNIYGINVDLKNCRINIYENVSYYGKLVS